MASASGGVAISMIPLGPNPKISPSAIQRDLASHWPQVAKLDNVAKAEEKVISFEIGDGVFGFLSLMPGPIPWSELEGPCATSVYWPEAADVLRPHKAHLVVGLTFKTDASPIEQSTLLTQLTAAVLGTCDASLGVYWGNATMVLPSELFRAGAVEMLPHELPIPIWVDYRVGSNEQGSTSGFSCGLKALGHMELETESATESPVDLRARLEGMTVYLLQHGPVINDGDTVGQDEKERITVRYAPSSFGHEGKVMRLEYESTKRKKRGWFGL